MEKALVGFTSLVDNEVKIAKFIATFTKKAWSTGNIIIFMFV